jgi:hypothetical protein
MSGLRQMLAQFHGAILHNDAGMAVEHLRDNGRLSPARQMAIYVQGYRLRLVGALRSDYPELLALLGDEVFDRLALRHIEANPPVAASLDHYPFAFAQSVVAHADVFAAELAALESAIAQVFLMEDSEALSPAMLAALTPEAFGATVLTLRKAHRLLAFTMPVEAYFSRRRAGEVASRPAPCATQLLVVRHENAVQRHALEPLEYALLAQFSGGCAVGDALDALVAAQPGCEAQLATLLQPWFSRWASHGFFQSPQE